MIEKFLVNYDSVLTNGDDDIKDIQCQKSKTGRCGENHHRWHQLNGCSETRIPLVREMECLEEIQVPLPSTSAKTKDEENKKQNFLKRELKRIRSLSFRQKGKTNIQSVSRNAKKANTFKAYVISEPTLKSGHENLEKFRCTPIVGGSTSGSRQLQFHPLQHGGIHVQHCQDLLHPVSSSSSASSDGSAHSTPASRRNIIINESDGYNGTTVHHQQHLSHFDRRQNGDAGLFSVRHTPAADASETSGTPACTNHKLFGALLPLEGHVQDSVSVDVERPFSIYDNRQNFGKTVPDSSDFDRPFSIYDNISKSNLNPASPSRRLLRVLDLNSNCDNGITVTDFNEPGPYWHVHDVVEEAELLKHRINSEGFKNRILGEQDRACTDSVVNSNFSQENADLGEKTDFLPEYLINPDKFRYHETSACKFPCHPEEQQKDKVMNMELDDLSAGQLMILRRFSVLKLTAIMETHTGANTQEKSSGKTVNFNRYVPSFIRRNRGLDCNRKSVFGISLLHNVRQTGQPIPKCIINAMNFLLSTSLDQTGLFRKPGVKSRIIKLCEDCEADSEFQYFEDWSAYEVADMIKQYFRDLPEPLMTAKLSDTFTGIFLHVPAELRHEAICAALMILPDENSQALRTLVWFLRSVASSSAENHMDESNLAVCFAPSLFCQQHQNTDHSSSSKQTWTRNKLRKCGGMVLGKPSTMDKENNLASCRCLAYLIKEFKHIFKIPEDAMTECRLSVMQQNPDVLGIELGYPAFEGLGRSSPQKMQEILADFHTYVDCASAQAIREDVRSKSWGWTQVPSAQGTELSYKKVNDGNCLRMWKCSVEIEGVTPQQVMGRIMSERRMWDEKLIQSKLIEKPDERTECLQIERSQLVPNLHRDYCVLRSWRTNQSSRDITVVVEISIDHPDAVVQNSIRGVVLTSRYLIEPISRAVWVSDSTSSNGSAGSNGLTQKCYLTHVSRVDMKGRNPEWYNKAYGHISLQLLQRIRDSFQGQQD